MSISRNQFNTRGLKFVVDSMKTRGGPMFNTGDIVVKYSDDGSYSPMFMLESNRERRGYIHLNNVSLYNDNKENKMDRLKIKEVNSNKIQMKDLPTNTFAVIEDPDSDYNGGIVFRCYRGLGNSSDLGFVFLQKNKNGISHFSSDCTLRVRILSPGTEITITT